MFPVKRIPSGDTNTIMNILAAKGLVAVGFNVVHSFMSYKWWFLVLDLCTAENDKFYIILGAEFTQNQIAIPAVLVVTL